MRLLVHDLDHHEYLVQGHLDIVTHACDLDDHTICTGDLLVSFPGMAR